MRKNNPQLDVSIIIVSWNVHDLLAACLHSVYESKQNVNYEIIVVDNASHDGSADMVAETFPNVVLIRNQVNKGFATACNQGAKQAHGKYLLFLNDDTIVYDHTLTRCLEYYDNHPQIGVLGCSVKNTDGTQQPSVWQLPRLKDQVVVLLKLHNFFPQLISSYTLKHFDYAKTQSVEQVKGAFFLTGRKVFDVLQGFDEKYFFWFEEVDYCTRVLQKDFTVVYFADAHITHHGGASIKQLRAVSEQKMFNAVVIRYFKKYKSKLAVFVITLASFAGLGLSYLVYVLELLNLNPKNKQ